MGLFGGTFDPVHCGHLELAAQARAQLALDEVRFIPCQQSPHKPGAPRASATERLEMLRLATAPHPWALVDALELSAPPPSYSVETAAAMAARFPGARLFWLLGGDQWEALPRWHQPERLAQLVEFGVFGRASRAPVPEGFRVHWLSGSHPASASAIRRDPAAVPAGWLAPAVADFIRTRGLYR